MSKFQVCDSILFHHQKYGCFSFSSAEPPNYERLLPLSEMMTIIPERKCYSFCLSISNSCNLSCNYCFNKQKDNKIMSPSKAISSLEFFFDCFPTGEKYYIDLSGKGEPLLALPTIIAIADWRFKKQNEIKKEIVVQFISNGTLLSPPIVKALQKHGVLFGVSIDGNRETHNSQRKKPDGSPTFDVIMRNVKRIKHKDFVGCGATISNTVFSLVEAITDLKNTFRTISFRTARGEGRLKEESSKRWQKEYELLSKRMLEEAKTYDFSTFEAIMNGDDLFGRFICMTFAERITINRCDGAVTRFSVDCSGQIYACPGSNEAIGIAHNLNVISQSNYLAQAKACADCDFKLFCGGECPIELSALGGPWTPTCELKKKLILLANWLCLKLQHENPAAYEIIKNLAEEKEKRRRENPDLAHFYSSHPTIPFSKAKKLFEAGQKRHKK